MTGPLDDLLAAYGQAPPEPSAPAEPVFSVIVRTQGERPRSLNEALDSLAAQTHTGFEVVLVVHGEDSRCDAVRESVADRLSDRIHILSVSGGGRSTPLNAGIEQAIGTHVCFLDDDDLVHDHWLSAFAAAIRAAPGAIIRAVTVSQLWSTDGSSEPLQAVGVIEHPYPDRFDLLAHMSLNQTPICALAYPRRAVDELGLRFCDDLAVYEDWDFLMRAAMIVGVVSIPDETSLYRRLDSGNADTAETVATWERCHALVVDRMSSLPVLLPAGDARRLAGTHFEPGGRSRHETDLAAAESTIDQLTRSPVRWVRAFGGRLRTAAQHRAPNRRRI